jgi:hypothetical protein
MPLTKDRSSAVFDAQALVNLSQLIVDTSIGSATAASAQTNIADIKTKKVVLIKRPLVNARAVQVKHFASRPAQRSGSQVIRCPMKKPRPQ